MPNRILDLSGRWQLSGFDGYGQSLTDQLLPAALPNLCWIDAEVPGSVYLDLMRAGWIADVYAGCNSLAARWVEQDYWFYRRHFDRPAGNAGERHFLVLDGLDLDAVIYLNGRALGEHHNAFRPMQIDVTTLLREKGNELIVRLNSGLLVAADRRGGDYNLELTAAVTKRAHLRKPQFACRWDWSPRLMNVGIGKGVRLESCSPARIQQVVVTAQLSDDHRHATLLVRAHVENVTDAAQALSLRCRVTGTPGCGSVETTLAPGCGEISCAIPMEDPHLWWPRSWGPAHLYEVETTLRMGDEAIATHRCHTGLRTIALRQDPDPQGGRLFQIAINGRPIFCKGANWVPADLLYSAVTPEDYHTLVGLAAECGCNLLRVWGGGHYAHHALLDACDRAGILVWHDLMFACSKYPGDDEAFVREVENEIRHNVRELASHPSLILWCGNNEVDLGIHDGWIQSYDRHARPCHELFHTRLAELVRSEDSSRPYWPTSPWSPDGSHPNDPSVGDQHPWSVALGLAKGDYWQYRSDASRFPNEGGMVGPSVPKTLREILPPEDRSIGSRTWLHHDNTQNTWRGAPLLDDLLHVNLCANPRALPFDDYIRYTALLQGEALETAIDNWRRRKFASAAAVFWMFNDTWPATTSWTPIDYYRRRKPSFWYVKRAFADLRAICVPLEDDLAVFVVNDLLRRQSVILRYGLFGLGGGRPIDETLPVECPANGAVLAASMPLSEWDRAGTTTHGAFAVLTGADGELSTHRLFRARFKDLAWEPAKTTIVRAGDTLRLRSEQFAWAVCLDADGEHALADNYFDLLPGVERTIRWPIGRPVPAMVQASNPSSRIVRP